MNDHGKNPISGTPFVIAWWAARMWPSKKAMRSYARKFLPAAGDYLAASLWRRVGLRIQETYLLDIRDWQRDLGQYGTWT